MSSDTAEHVAPQTKALGLLRWRNWLWVVPAVIGIVPTLLILVVQPPDRTLDNIGELLFKLSPMLFAVPTIALFPRHRRLAGVLVVLGYLLYMGVLDSANVVKVFDYAAVGAKGFNEFYQFTLFINAFTVLFALFAFRMGGARVSAVLKVGSAGILIVISGMNDLSFWAMADWDGPRPDRLDWASHISVFIGHAPSVTEAVLFAAVHLVLAGVIFALPLDRWIGRLAGVGGREQV